MGSFPCRNGAIATNGNSGMSRQIENLVRKFLAKPMGRQSVLHGESSGFILHCCGLAVSACTAMHTYVYGHTHTHVHAHHTYICTCMHPYICACTPVYTYAHAHTHAHKCTTMAMYTCSPAMPCPHAMQGPHWHLQGCRSALGS